MKTVILCLITFALYGTDFGYVYTNQGNIGDDIQSLAAMQFLPQECIPIQREFLGSFSHPNKVQVLMNGWYMLKYQGTFQWPPSESIDPFFLSIHFDSDLIPIALSDENVKYLKKHAPIGARDTYTLDHLLSKNIPSFFSGCLTLTFRNDAAEREDVIYAIDIGDDCEAYLRAHTKTPVVSLTHKSDEFKKMSLEGRQIYAKELLEKYKRAKCVVTSRLHAALPSLAFHTPVLLVNTHPDQSRFEGILPLLRHVSSEQFLKGNYSFDFDHPSPNSDAYLYLRNKLIHQLKLWRSRS